MIFVNPSAEAMKYWIEYISSRDRSLIVFNPARGSVQIEFRDIEARLNELMNECKIIEFKSFNNTRQEATFEISGNKFIKISAAALMEIYYRNKED